ncbi:CCL1 isoform 1 [Pan troglodytes]|uniref:C-C motif chemokine n=2 Tax=Pan troglodytes TaxID=9598 RepID=A0A6D2WX07_PANTR|nr:C-C motif chemokine 1 [Pan troglodytes]PNI47300.1 CCL1 isoform 1 [Pan troglodytes]
MQIITTALVCLLLAGMWPEDVDSKSMQVPFSRCCFSFAEQEISLRAILCYRNTSSICSNEGLIFKLKRGKEACALDTVGWVQRHRKMLRHCPSKIK